MSIEGAHATMTYCADATIYSHTDFGSDAKKNKMIPSSSKSTDLQSQVNHNLKCTLQNINSKNTGSDQRDADIQMLYQKTLKEVFFKVVGILFIIGAIYRL